jgi:hypothetical protein
VAGDHDAIAQRQVLQPVGLEERIVRHAGTPCHSSRSSPKMFMTVKITVMPEHFLAEPWRSA